MDVRILLLACLRCGLAAVPPTRTEVKQLPGLQGQLPSRMFTGHIPAGTPPNGKGTMYYYYVMYESEGNPKTDPVLIWYNGGPGASSLFGLFQELGPLMLNAASYDEHYKKSGIPSPQRNPFSWSKAATVIAIDSPAPAGFSYCDPAGPTGNGYSCGPWNDTTVADANHIVITKLFNDVFPHLLPNKLFIVGESYAGVYVPLFADRLMDDPRGVNLAGFAVGDGCMGNDVLCGSNYKAGPWYQIEFLHGRGQFSNELYNAIRKECPEVALRTGVSMTKQCKALVAEVDAEVGGYFAYNLYDDCIYEEPIALGAEESSSVPSGRGEMNGYPCPGVALKKWFNSTVVKQAIGLDTDAVFFLADNGVGMNYTVSEPDIRHIYTKAMRAGLRTLIYNGDTDPGIDSGVTQDKWVEWTVMKKLIRTQRWRPWTLDGRQRMGGYVMEWSDAGFNGSFSYLTLRGSGHMVPEYKPAAALSMISTFLSGDDYPKYVKPPKAPPHAFSEVPVSVLV